MSSIPTLISCLICWQPLVKRQQAALSSQLSKQLERINLDLKEKVGCFSVNNKYSFLRLAVCFQSSIYQYSCTCRETFLNFTAQIIVVQKLVLLPM